VANANRNIPVQEEHLREAPERSVPPICLHQKRVPVECRDDILLTQRDQEVVIDGGAIWDNKRRKVAMDPFL